MDDACYALCTFTYSGIRCPFEIFPYERIVIKTKHTNYQINLHLFPIFTFGAKILLREKRFDHFSLSFQSQSQSQFDATLNSASAHQYYDQASIAGWLSSLFGPSQIWKHAGLVCRSRSSALATTRIGANETKTRIARSSHLSINVLLRCFFLASSGDYFLWLIAAVGYCRQSVLL